MSDDLASAGISAKERLGNIEEVLKSIDSKLDGKADRSYVVALELRVRELELSHAKADAAERVVNLERATTAGRLEGRVGKLEESSAAVGRKLAAATGVVTIVVVVANFFGPLWLK